MLNKFQWGYQMRTALSMNDALQDAKYGIHVKFYVLKKE
jgi:hypothetical protein